MQADELDLIFEESQMSPEPTVQSIKKTELCRQTLQLKEEERAQFRYHTVARGETMLKVAYKYNLSLNQLRILNEMDPTNSSTSDRNTTESTSPVLEPGTRLRIGYRNRNARDQLHNNQELLRVDR